MPSQFVATHNDSGPFRSPQIQEIIGEKDETFDTNDSYPFHLQAPEVPKIDFQRLQQKMSLQ